MSSTTNTPYMTKSMNGIIVLSDGAGTTIEGGTITTDNLDLVNLNVDNIAGIADGDNINLYTATTGDITLGSYSANLISVKGINASLASSTLTTIESGTKVSVLSPTLELVISGKVKIGGGQDLEPLILSNGLKIGNDITSSNLTLGNATYPPSCAATATTANHICNLSTVQSLITTSNTSSFPTGIKTDTIDCFTTGSTTAYVLWNDNFNTTNSFIRIGSTQPTNNTAFQIAENNGDVFIGNNYPRSASINICNERSYSGTISIANNDTTSLTNIINMGNNKTNLNICNSSGYAGTININASSLVPNIIRMGGTVTTTTLNSITTNITGSSNVNINVSGGNTNINSTNGTGNVNLGTGSTGTVSIGKSNSTAININRGLTPTYSYDGSTGTNIVGTIGYIYRGSVSTGSLPNSSLQTHGTISNVPIGVYYVYASVCVDTTTVGQVTYQQYSIDTGVDTNPFAILGICSGTAPGNCSDRTYFGNLSGIVSLTATSTIRVRTFWQFSSGSFTRNGTSFSFAAVRIA
jgi:hypothetical protein